MGKEYLGIKQLSLLEPSRDAHGKVWNSTLASVLSLLDTSRRVFKNELLVSTAHSSDYEINLINQLSRSFIFLNQNNNLTLWPLGLNLSSLNLGNYH